MSRDDRFPFLLRAFFYEWLVEQRNASIHTVRSYRDTWRLLLRFVAQRAGKKVAMITLADLAASEIAAFLRHAEHERGGTIGTRNCRLAAIRSFFHFVATRDPALIAQCVEVLHIPVKRAPASEPCYLDPAEVRRSSLSQIVRPLRACAIMRCCRFSTTAAHEYRKRSTCAPKQSGSKARTACA